MAESEVLIKSRAVITCQEKNATYAFQAGEFPTDSTWNTNDTVYCGGTPTVIDNTYNDGTENGKGADYLNLHLLVTDAPATAATVQVWYSESEDGTNYTQYSYSHTVPETISATDGIRYKAGEFKLTANFTKLALAAVGYDIPDMTLLGYPKLNAIQAQA